MPEAIKDGKVVIWIGKQAIFGQEKTNPKDQCMEKWKVFSSFHNVASQRGHSQCHQSHQIIHHDTRTTIAYRKVSLKLVWWGLEPHQPG